MLCSVCHNTFDDFSSLGGVDECPHCSASLNYARVWGSDNQWHSFGWEPPKYDSNNNSTSVDSSFVFISSDDDSSYNGSYGNSVQEEPFDFVALGFAIAGEAVIYAVCFIIKHIVTFCHVVFYCIAGIIILNLCALLIYGISEMVRKIRKNNSKRIKAKTRKPSKSVPTTQARCSSSPIGQSSTIIVTESKYWR